MACSAETAPLHCVSAWDQGNRGDLLGKEMAEGDHGIVEGDRGESPPLASAPVETRPLAESSSSREAHSEDSLVDDCPHKTAGNASSNVNLKNHDQEEKDDAGSANLKDRVNKSRIDGEIGGDEDDKEAEMDAMSQQNMASSSFQASILPISLDGKDDYVDGYFYPEEFDTQDFIIEPVSFIPDNTNNKPVENISSCHKHTLDWNNEETKYTILSVIDQFKAHILPLGNKIRLALDHLHSLDSFKNVHRYSEVQFRKRYRDYEEQFIKLYRDSNGNIKPPPADAAPSNHLLYQMVFDAASSRCNNKDRVVNHANKANNGSTTLFSDFMFDVLTVVREHKLHLTREIGSTKQNWELIKNKVYNMPQHSSAPPISATNLYQRYHKLKRQVTAKYIAQPTNDSQIIQLSGDMHCVERLMYEMIMETSLQKNADIGNKENDTRKESNQVISSCNDIVAEDNNMSVSAMENKETTLAEASVMDINIENVAPGMEEYDSHGGDIANNNMNDEHVNDTDNGGIFSSGIDNCLDDYTEINNPSSVVESSELDFVDNLQYNDIIQEVEDNVNHECHIKRHFEGGTEPENYDESMLKKPKVNNEQYENEFNSLLKDSHDNQFESSLCRQQLQIIGRVSELQLLRDIEICQIRKREVELEKSLSRENKEKYRLRREKLKLEKEKHRGEVKMKRNIQSNDENMMLDKDRT
jgi:hypothetical protein